MKFESVDAAQAWSTNHGQHIYVEVFGADGVLEVYPGGRKIFVASNKGKIYERWRRRLTPAKVFGDRWTCRERGCGVSHDLYENHIAHVVNAHGGLTGKIESK